MILYRPVGMNELQLIYQSKMTAFPPRLPEQPIFYPVLNVAYAEKIARDWNTKSPPWAGYVAQFEVDDKYVSKFEPQIVGANWHEELWVPAEELAEFNCHINAPITVVSAFFGSQFEGNKSSSGSLQNRAAFGQFIVLAAIAAHSPFDLHQEILNNSETVFLNYRFWAQTDFSGQGIDNYQRDEILAKIRAFWDTDFKTTPL